MFESTIKYNGINIWIKPVCEFFNLDVQNQYNKIKKDPILGKLYEKNSTDSQKNSNILAKNSTDFDENYDLRTKKSKEFGEIDKNGRILLSKKGFIRWIQIINAKTVASHLRDKFIQYQELITDYLYGTLQDQLHLKTQHDRLKKLKKLYSKIGLEIKRVEKTVSSLMDKQFFQYSIEFPENKKLQ